MLHHAQSAICAFGSAHASRRRLAMPWEKLGLARPTAMQGPLSTCQLGHCKVPQCVLLPRLSPRWRRAWEVALVHRPRALPPQVTALLQWVRSATRILAVRHASTMARKRGARMAVGVCVATCALGDAALAEVAWHRVLSLGGNAASSLRCASRGGSVKTLADHYQADAYEQG